VLFFLLIVLFYVLFACKCVLYYCYRVSIQLQLTNISYHIISYIISYRTSHHIISYHIISYQYHTLTRFNAFTTVTYDPNTLVLRNKSSAPLPPVGKSITVNKYHIISHIKSHPPRSQQCKVWHAFSLWPRRKKANRWIFTEISTWVPNSTAIQGVLKKTEILL
jgi:hypothetical protein